MIKNYLDFVKVRRTLALRNARENLDKSRRATDEWQNGFHRGLKLAYDFESRHWRILQKDIEARERLGLELKFVSPMVPEYTIKLV